MSAEHGNLLGHEKAYPDHYDPTLLQPIDRGVSRQALAHVAPFGVDLWTAFEISYLNPRGKPCVAVAELAVPADSLNIIESKSLKYYFNSFNQEPFESRDAVKEKVASDLSRAAGASVGVSLYSVDDYLNRSRKPSVSAILLDDIDIKVEHYAPASELLQYSDQDDKAVYCSHLLKSNCPVTGQPDWASVWIGFKGRKINPEGLLAYLISFRQHQDFHEHCVERIFSDLWASGHLTDLWVYARYTRRGGLDINPFRSSSHMNAPTVFAGRQ